MGRQEKGALVKLFSGENTSKCFERAVRNESEIWRRPGVKVLREDFYAADTLAWLWTTECIWNETSEEEGDGGSKPVYCWLLGTRSLINRKHRSQRTNSSDKPQVAALE